MELSEFDIKTTSAQTRMLKFFLPCLNTPLQKHIALIIRITELRETLNYYNHLSPCEYNKENFSMDALIGQLLKMNPDALNLFNNFQVQKPENNPPNTDNSLYQMMNEEQNNLYEQYLNEINIS